MHIHPAATYVPPFQIGVCVCRYVCMFVCMYVVQSSPRARSTRMSLYDAATGGGINYFSPLVISPRSREVFLSEKAEISRARWKQLWVRAVYFFSLLALFLRKRAVVIYMHSWSNKQLLRERGVRVRERFRGISTGSLFVFGSTRFTLMRHDYHRRNTRDDHRAACITTRRDEKKREHPQRCAAMFLRLYSPPLGVSYS